ncbi:hypothetical protein CTI14_29750, partial [Methylobacterium radiotolerans]
EDRRDAASIVRALSSLTDDDIAAGRRAIAAVEPSRSRGGSLEDRRDAASIVRALSSLTDDDIAAGRRAIAAVELPDWQTESASMLDEYRRVRGAA